MPSWAAGLALGWLSAEQAVVQRPSSTDSLPAVLAFTWGRLVMIWSYSSLQMAEQQPEVRPSLRIQPCAMQMNSLTSNQDPSLKHAGKLRAFL